MFLQDFSSTSNALLGVRDAMVIWVDGCGGDDDDDVVVGLSLSSDGSVANNDTPLVNNFVICLSQTNSYSFCAIINACNFGVDQCVGSVISYVVSMIFTVHKSQVRCCSWYQSISERRPSAILSPRQTYGVVNEKSKSRIRRDSATSGGLFQNFETKFQNLQTPVSRLASTVSVLLVYYLAYKTAGVDDR